MMEQGSKKVVYAALVGNLFIASIKFGGAVYTGSSAMLSEAVHSLVDTGNEALLLYGMHRARLPADDAYPFGHGKEIYFWSFIVALLVFALGAGVSMYEGIQQLRRPTLLEDSTVNYIILGLAFLFEGGSWGIALREFRSAKGRFGYIESVERGKDPTTFTVLFEDSAALLGIAVAFAGILLTDLTANPYFDGAASVIIGLILGATALWLARETKGLLIGESANREVVEGIRALVRQEPEVDRVNEILTMHMGPNFILVNISLHVAQEADRSRVHHLFDNIDRRIKAQYSNVQRVFIESETVPARSG
jgi:cation diffusion facilitator family transporter